MINEQYKYSELTGKIIKCAMTFHSSLGNGFSQRDALGTGGDLLKGFGY